MVNKRWRYMAKIYLSRGVFTIVHMILWLGQGNHNSYLGQTYATLWITFLRLRRLSSMASTTFLEKSDQGGCSG